MNTTKLFVFFPVNKYSPGPEYLDTPARNINMISIQAVNVLGSNNCRQCTEFGQPANAERRMPYAEGQTLYLDRTSTYARKHESTKARKHDYDSNEANI
jgi:hypothetical protein